MVFQNAFRLPPILHPISIIAEFEIRDLYVEKSSLKDSITPNEDREKLLWDGFTSHLSMEKENR